MLKIRYFFLLILLTSWSLDSYAQDDEVLIRLRAGHNVTFGGFGALSLETVQNFDRHFQLSGGVQYNTIGRTALEARPACFMDYDWGRISAEALLTYRNMMSVNSFAVGAGAEISGRWAAMKLGYYYHTYGHKGESIKEPFNIYYELRVSFLPMIDDWDLQFVLTNNERFELERHYQPSFLAECRHDMNDSISLSAGLGCKPAGMFNLSVGYYQSFINLGICYRW